MPFCESDLKPLTILRRRLGHPDTNTTGRRVGRLPCTARQPIPCLGSNGMPSRQGYRLDPARSGSPARRYRPPRRGRRCSARRVDASVATAARTGSAHPSFDGPWLIVAAPRPSASPTLARHARLPRSDHLRVAGRPARRRRLALRRRAAPSACAPTRAWSSSGRAAEIRRRARLAAWRLRAAGLAPGDRLLTWSPSTPRLPAVYWGAMRAGVIVVPLDLRMAPAVLQRIADRAETRSPGHRHRGRTRPTRWPPASTHSRSSRSTS